MRPAPASTVGVMSAPATCPVCGLAPADLRALAAHLVEEAARSEGGHVMWLNRNATKHRTSAAGLEPLLEAALAGRGGTEDRVRR